MCDGNEKRRHTPEQVGLSSSLATPHYAAYIIIGTRHYVACRKRTYDVTNCNTVVHTPLRKIC